MKVKELASLAESLLDSVTIAPDRRTCRYCDGTSCHAGGGFFAFPNQFDPDQKVELAVLTKRCEKLASPERTYWHEVWHLICYLDRRYFNMSKELVIFFGPPAGRHIEAGWGELTGNTVEELAADTFAFLMTGLYVKLPIHTDSGFLRSKRLVERAAPVLDQMINEKFVPEDHGPGWPT